MVLSVIIPVLHEEDLINAAIDRLRSSPSQTAPEIIVVDGAPEADTLAALKSPDVTRIRSATGRARQMNAGAAAATGEVLLFLHADTELPVDGFSRIEEVMEDGRSAGGAFDLAIAGDGFALRLIERAATLRSRLTRTPYGDQAIFIGRHSFQEIGGYPDIPIMEDVELMRRLKKGGHKIHLIRDKVTTSGRRWQKEGAVKCTLRNWTIMLLYLAGIPPERLARWYQ